MRPPHSFGVRGLATSKTRLGPSGVAPPASGEGKGTETELITTGQRFNQLHAHNETSIKNPSQGV